jgi:hypothetical protein
LTKNIEANLIGGAWPERLAEFVSATRHELLIASPWITEPAAKLISHQLAAIGPVSVHILARLEEADFFSGSSHIASFRTDTYPSHDSLAFRALPMLHGKMLVSDRERVILGSANLTEGGLYRNHEISLLLDSHEIAEACAAEFFRLWSVACEIPDNYLINIAAKLDEALPSSDEEDQRPIRPQKPRRKQGTASSSRFRYVNPVGGRSARSLIMRTLHLPLPDMSAHEETGAARNWLERTLKFLPSEERSTPQIVQRLEQLMHHPEVGVRATAIDRAGRTRNRSFLPRLHALATNVAEPREVRSAAAFAVTVLGSPESFSCLSTLLSEPGDLGRWAMRGCFMLLNDIDHDAATWLLGQIGVLDKVALIGLAKNCAVGRGTISERLTKALLLEQCATGRWAEEDVELLVAVMVLTALAIKTHGRRLNIQAVAKYSADALSIAAGDLRHGPLSPSLLERNIASGIAEPGLANLIGKAWDSFNHSPKLAQNRLQAQEKTRKVLSIIEDTEVNRGRR